MSVRVSKIYFLLLVTFIGVKGEWLDSERFSTCQCSERFTGEWCKQCAEGYYGWDCHPCPDCSGNNGLCINGYCQCNHPYAGYNCNQCVNGYYLSSSPSPSSLLTCVKCKDCGSHGYCDGTTGNCICYDNYSGEYCEVPPPPKTCPTCQYGYCDMNTGVCICDTNYTGENCNECVPNCYGNNCSQCPYDCGEHGYCDDGMYGSGHCNCHIGWYGTRCDRKRHHYS